MSERFDRYRLAMAVLDGEKDAHKILGDLLEEQGQRGLAQWARSRKSKRRKRLDFVLALLPHDAAIRLACDFVGHLGDEKTWQLARRLADAARAGLRHAESQAGLEEVGRQFQLLAQEAWKMGSASQCLECLAEAWEHAKLAAEHRRRGEMRKFHHDVDETCVAVRQLAHRAQQLGGARSWSLWRRQPGRPIRDELQWQIEQTRQVLETLLEDPTG